MSDARTCVRVFPRETTAKRTVGRILPYALLAAALSIIPPARASQAVAESLTSDSVTSQSALQAESRAISGVTSGWTSGEVRWYYDAAGEPASLRGQVEGLIYSAAAEWSAHCDVRFVYAGATAALPRTLDGKNVVGWNANQPYSGITFPQTSGGQMVEAGIEMNPNITNDPEFAAEVLVHELGHVLGLDHSDVQDAVMSGPPYTSYSYETRLSEDDISGCQALYDNKGCTSAQPAPLVTTVACSPPLIGERTLRRTSVCSHHAWTLNPPTVLSNDCQAAVAPPVAVPVPVPVRPATNATVKEYHRAANDDYFMTASPVEQALLDANVISGWKATGHSFAAWTSPVTGANAVCRFYGDWRVDAASGARLGPDTHFYTADAGECDSVPVRWPVWVLETRTAFYVLPATNGVCALGMLPVWRYFHPTGEPTHRYITDAAIVTQLAQSGWTSEGAVFCTTAS